MKVLTAFVILLFAVVNSSSQSTDEGSHACWSKPRTTKLFEETSIKTRQNRPICSINRFLCRNVKASQVQADMDALIDLFNKWNVKYSGQDPAFHFLGMVTALGKMRRDSQLCSKTALDIIIHSIPQFLKHFPQDKLMDSDRINKILYDILSEHATVCPEVTMDRFSFLRKSFNKGYMHYIMATLGKIVASHLEVGPESNYTREHFVSRREVIHFNSEPVARMLIDGVKSIADDQTAEYIKQQQQQPPKKSKQKQKDPKQSPEMVSYRKIANILRHYVVKPCGFFIDHFASLFPSVTKGDFDRFGAHLEPVGENSSGFYQHWIIYDVCRHFNHELQTYFNPITKFVVAEFNGHGKFQELEPQNEVYKRMMNNL